LRIAQVAPLFESVPPKLYGGTERVVSYLTEELVLQGHDVTLFASGDSETRARLVAPVSRALRLDESCHDPIAPQICQLHDVFSSTERFDIIHFHNDYFHFPLSTRQRLPHLTTLHGRLDLPALVPIYRRFVNVPVVSISDAQREPLPWIAWQRTVLHGLPLDLHTLGAGAGGYLAFLGRISPEKRVDRAIEIARRLGLPLKIAAKVAQTDRAYYEAEIKPLLKAAGTDVEFVGEIGEPDKTAFLGDAAALLFPIDWPEPFGLVMVEAMACGTPVIAWRCGSVPEVVDPGTTGFIVDNVDEAVTATERAITLSRTACRERFEERFNVTRMAADYVEIYQRLAETRTEIQCLTA
jgi:glycosyltransferase involved in cell wall biosynthesis